LPPLRYYKLGLSLVDVKSPIVFKPMTNQPPMVIVFRFLIISVDVDSFVTLTKERMKAGYAGKIVTVRLELIMC